MRSPCRLLLFLLLFHLSVPASADPLLEQMRAKLAGLQAYSIVLVSQTFPSRMLDVAVEGEEPKVEFITSAVGMAPDKLVLRASDGQEFSTQMTFDGVWQWTDTQRFSDRESERRVSKISQSIARPGKPFDTFFYLTGTGLFAGEDFPGTFTEILRLYTFGPGATANFEGIACQVYSGKLSSEAFNTYLKARGQAGVADITARFKSSMGQIRLAVDPETSLPIGYSMGSSLEEPSSIVAITYSSLDPSGIPENEFTFEAPEGYAVFDDTARTAAARVAALSIEPDSDLFTAVSKFLQQPNPMPDALVSLFEQGALDQAWEMIKATPELAKTTSPLGNPALYHYALDGDVKITKALLEFGADPNVKCELGQTALHVAAERGNAETVTILIQHQADPNARDNDGHTPLHQTSDKAIADLLVAGGANPDLLDNFGQHAAVVTANSPAAKMNELLNALFIQGDFEATRRLVREGVSPVAVISSHEYADLPFVFDAGDTPLAVAASTSEAAVRVLWEAWDSPKDSAERRTVATSLLGKAATPEIVKYLISQGADLTADGGESPLTDSLVANAAALLEAGLVPRPATATSRGDFQLMFMKRQNRYDDIDPVELGKLLDKILEQTGPAEIDARDPLGVLATLVGATSLHYAAERGDEYWVDWLLERGAKPDLSTDDGWTPLHLAALSGNRKVVETLLRKGASPKTCEANGWTPLHSVAYAGQPTMLSLLLEKGADVSAKDKLGNTPLHLAASAGRLEAAKLLVAHGADKDAKNDDGETPADLLSQRDRATYKF